MEIQVLIESPASLRDYATVPISYEARERLVLDNPDACLAGLALRLESVAPYVNDYDAHPDNQPTAWPTRFDMSSWGILAAWSNGVRVGGATIAWGTPAVQMLEDRDDLAVLWDIRVAPSHRGLGVGSMLFHAAEEWARFRGAAWLKAETQNVNVPACRFYVRRGCTLGGINRFAYPALPTEIQLLWYKAVLRA